MFKELFPYVIFRSFSTKVNMKSQKRATTSIDFLFNIKNRNHCEALWLFFHEIDSYSDNMYVNRYALGGLPFKLYLNKKEEIFNSSALLFEKKLQKQNDEMVDQQL